MSWTNEVLEELNVLKQQYPAATYQELSDRLNGKFGTSITSEALRKKLSRTKKNNISFFDQKNAEEPDVEGLLEAILRTQEKFHEIDDKQTSLTLDIDDDKPIGIAFTGDQHIGGVYTDHRGMLRDYEKLQATNGLFSVLMGDLTDNYITRSHAGGSFDQVMTADKQKMIAEHIITKFFSEKCLAVLKGNHDQWSVKETGEDFIAYLARKIKTPYMFYGGEINLRLGDVVYKIHAHHTYLYNSSLNTTNSQRNLFNATHADVIALGHLHFNEVHSKKTGGKDTVWMRTGTYKIKDDYTQYLGGLAGDTRVPMAIFWPDKKKVLGFQSIYDGIPYLEMLRNEK